MMTQVDAVFVPTDNTIAGAMQTLVKNADAANKPIFPTVDTMVKDGGVATYSINQYKLGVQGGKLAGQILKGKKETATTAIQYIRHGEPTLNLKQAKKLDYMSQLNSYRMHRKMGRSSNEFNRISNRARPIMGYLRPRLISNF